MPLSRAALATAPVAVVGSVALAIGTAGAADAAETHDVQPGDTVSGIAIRNGLQTVDLLRWNDLTSATASSIRAGQTLVLHAPKKQKKAHSEATGAKPGAKTHTVASGETLWSIASEHRITLNALVKANDLKASSIIYPGQKLKLSGSATSSGGSPTPASGKSSSTSGSHTVVSGDTLWSIASANDTTVGAILDANGLERGAIIYPGQKLELEAPREKATAENPQRFASLDADQAANARLIIRVGRSLGVGDRAVAEALATAVVESSLRNVSHGHLDSIGLFQQRTSQGWGTKKQIMDRTRAVEAFFGGANDPNGYRTRGLFDVPGWQNMPFGEPAQIVQFSGHPDRYAQWKVQSYRWISELG